MDWPSRVEWSVPIGPLVRRYRFGYCSRACRPSSGSPTEAPFSNRRADHGPENPAVRPAAIPGAEPPSNDVRQARRDEAYGREAGPWSAERRIMKDLRAFREATQPDWLPGRDSSPGQRLDAVVIAAPATGRTNAASCIAPEIPRECSLAFRERRTGASVPFRVAVAVRT